MTHTTTVALSPGEVLARAQAFFLERVPNTSAFVEKSGPNYLILRGQGGEEIAVNATPVAGDASRSRIRASTLFFDQALDRFFSTLPLEAEVVVA